MYCLGSVGDGSLVGRRCCLGRGVDIGSLVDRGVDCVVLEDCGV